jgi:hypothetical protein
VSDLLVLLRDALKELLDDSLLAVGVVAELHHLLLQSVETESKVINVLTWLEGQVLPLLTKCLQRGLAGAVAANVCHSDDVPGLLGSPLLGKRELHLEGDCSNEGIQRPSILIVVDVAVPNCFPHVPHLEPYRHHRGPLDVVGLGEGRPPVFGTDVPDNDLDLMVTMVPVRGGRVVLPVNAAISVDPAYDVPMPVWAVAAVGGKAAVRAPSLTSLSSLSLSPSAEIELSVLLARRASSSAVAACAAFAVAAAGTSALAAVSSAITSLAAVAAVSVAACLRSSAGAAWSRRPSVETILRTWHASGGCCIGKRLPQMSCCSAVQERRDEQGQLVFLLPAEDRERRGKGMSRRCLGYMIERL